MSMQAMQQQDADIAPNANNVPNFPQDAYMEGPMMNMDALVHKPENYGLRPGWTRYMQGMMTFLRVLPPDKYDEVVARMRQAQRPGDPYAPLYAGEKGRGVMKSSLMMTALLAFPLAASAQMESMPGMQASRTPPAQTMPKDMRAPSHGDPAAKRETRSMRASEAEQKGKAAIAPGTNSDTDSMQVESFTVQERENPGGHTGATMPDVDLLTEVAARRPMNLEDFLTMASTLEPNPGADAGRGGSIGAAGTPGRADSESDDRIQRRSHTRRGVSRRRRRCIRAARLCPWRQAGGCGGMSIDNKRRENQIGVQEQQERVDASVEEAFYSALTEQAEVVVRQRMLQHGPGCIDHRASTLKPRPERCLGCTAAEVEVRAGASELRRRAAKLRDGIPDTQRHSRQCTTAGHTIAWEHREAAVSGRKAANYPDCGQKSTDAARTASHNDRGGAIESSST